MGNCYLHGQMLHGLILHVQMLHGHILHSQMSLGQLSIVEDGSTNLKFPLWYFYQGEVGAVKVEIYAHSSWTITGTEFGNKSFESKVVNKNCAKSCKQKLCKKFVNQEIEPML